MNLLRTLYMAIICACCLLMPTACTDSSPEAAAEGTPFYLTFTIITKTGSRADSSDNSDPSDNSDNSDSSNSSDQPGTIPENYLDIHDLRYVIFDEEGNFISDLTPEASIRAINDNLTLYEVRARITAPYFQEHINDFINFYILVLANYSPWGLTLGDLHAGVSLADFFNSRFSMSTIPDTSRLLLSPTAEDALPFPMAGLQYFSINGRNLLNTSPSEPFNLSTNALGKTVNMLRALSKIEVIDRINLLENTVFDPSLHADPLRISGVTLEGFFNRGTIVPAFSQWHINDMAATAQVSAPTIPANATYCLPPPLGDNHTITPTPSLSGYSLPFQYDATATAARSDKCPVYSCYTFEYSRAALESVSPAIATSQYPYLLVSLHGSDIDPEQSHPVTLPLRLPEPAATTTPTPITSLLRNHIYRYEIMGVSHELKFSWTVCPMDNLSADITFK